ncbi:hypothetical protein ABZX65_26915 [Streptomyces sp. NPDC003300]|uniref:hypothetical protein n=1 Tax=unclassified Streptomyces TaxID=2593676 RepID=UPI00339E5996
MTDDLIADCAECGASIGWVECPSGSWWSHRVHPAKDHDAHPVSCPRCKGSGIDPVYSYPAEGPSYYSMGEPEWLEPCIACQYPQAKVMS